MNLAEIYDEYREDPAFSHLRTDGIVLVPGEGSTRPRIMIVGEAPGATENTDRRPFVGATGRILRSLITDVAGLDVAEYFITNTVKYRPPGNRNPTWEEIEASKPYLRREWRALARPPVVVAVGGVAFSALRAAGSSGILFNAGKRFALPSGVTLAAMVHPRYAIGNESYRPTMEGHWDAFGKWYRSTARSR